MMPTDNWIPGFGKHADQTGSPRGRPQLFQKSDPMINDFESRSVCRGHPTNRNAISNLQPRSDAKGRNQPRGVHSHERRIL